MPKLLGAQSDNFSKINLDTIKTPHFYINVGAGLVNGLRADFIYKFHKSISAEISYGSSPGEIIPLFPFLNVESRFTLGLNWHSETSFPFIISLLTVYSTNKLKNRGDIQRSLFPLKPRYLISLNGGYLNMRKSGFKVIARAGFYIEYYKDNYAREIKFGGFYPNAEIGIGLVF